MEAMKYSGRQNPGISWKIPNEDAAVRPDFREKMLEKNRIAGILPFEISEKDGQREYIYRIENMESLAARCVRTKLNGTQIKALLTGVLSVIFRGSEFMLNENDFCISYDSVFFDSENRVMLVYFPDYNHNIIEQLRELADYAMNNIDYHDDESVVLTYSFYMRTKEDNCSLEALAQLLKGKTEDCREADLGERTENSETSFGYRRKECSEDKAVGKREESAGMRIRERREEDFHKTEYGFVFENKGDCGGQTYQTSSHREKADYSSEDILEIRGEGSNGENVRENPGETVAAEIKNVFMLCTMVMKAKLILCLMIPILVLGVIFFMGFLNDAKGNPDYLKIAAAVTVTVAVVLWGERKMFLPLFRDYRNVKRAAQDETEDERTVLLYMDDRKEECEKTLCSLVSDDYEPINITHVPFFIGSGKKMDSVLGETGISRRHLRVDSENGSYTVTDLGSTNGTRVNGKLLTPNEAAHLKRGDKVEMGGCVYFFN